MHHRTVLALIIGAVLALPCRLVFGGTQTEEQLSASVRAGLSASLSDRAAPEPLFPSVAAKTAWLSDRIGLLARRIPEIEDRMTFLKTVYYEATRAGLDPELILGLIQTESNFRKYAVSSVGARGYMQVMPFWVQSIGQPTDNLFHLRTNLRYGCSILRHYLDIERGNLFLALGRYNGSRGQSAYPNLVLASWSQWHSKPAGYQVATK